MCNGPLKNMDSLFDSFYAAGKYGHSETGFASAVFYIMLNPAKKAFNINKSHYLFKT